MVQLSAKTELDPVRRVPEFLVIGAMRAGTTTLHNYLANLPSLVLPKMKETDFFIASKNWPLGIDWYESLFAADGAPIPGEISPNYTKRDVFPEVPGNVAQANPDVRLIYVVRDPVLRALSQYKHTWGVAGLPGPSELEGTWEERHILATSRYAWQMEAWLEHFPREQILVLDFKTLTSQPKIALRKIADHIGFPMPEGFEDFQHHNSAQQVARMPKWWHSLRDSSVGVRARAIASPKLVGAMKSIVQNNKAPEPPKIPADMKRRFAEALREDAIEFRKQTGLLLDHWLV